jgi:hypothetical protein
MERVEGMIRRLDPSALVLDQTGGWSLFSLSGASPAAIFHRVAGFPLPAHRPSLAQGAFAQVPGKAILEAERFHLLVPARLEHFLPPRFLEIWGDEGARVGPRGKLTVTTPLLVGPGTGSREVVS